MVLSHRTKGNGHKLEQKLVFWLGFCLFGVFLKYESD